MNKLVLKSVIINLKESGLSYDKISKKLLEDYGVEMSRQAVCGMYKRIKSNSSINNTKDIIIVINDIINYHCLGLSKSEIQKILKNNDIKISLSEIQDAIDSNSKEIETISSDIINKIIQYIDYEIHTDYIKRNISYKNINLKDNKMYDYIKLAVNKILNNTFTDTLNKLSRITDDKVKINKIINASDIKIN